MRNAILFIAFFCIYFNVNAQFTPGQKMLGGVIGFSDSHQSSSSSSTNQTSFLTALSFSTFNKPMSFNSFGIDYGYSGVKGGAKINQIGLFYGYTKLETLAKRFYLGLTGGGSVNYVFSKQYNSSGILSAKANGLGISATGGLGLHYQLNNRFLLSANLIDLIVIKYYLTKGYTLDASNNLIETSKTSDVSFTTGLTGFTFNNISVGVRYLLK